MDVGIVQLKIVLRIWVKSYRFYCFFVCLFVCLLVLSFLKLILSFLFSSLWVSREFDYVLDRYYRLQFSSSTYYYVDRIVTFFEHLEINKHFTDSKYRNVVAERYFVKLRREYRERIWICQQFIFRHYKRLMIYWSTMANFDVLVFFFLGNLINARPWFSWK